MTTEDPFKILDHTTIKYKCKYAFFPMNTKSHLLDQTKIYSGLTHCLLQSQLPAGASSPPATDNHHLALHLSSVYKRKHIVKQVQQEVDCGHSHRLPSPFPHMDSFLYVLVFINHSYNTQIYG